MKFVNYLEARLKKMSIDCDVKENMLVIGGDGEYSKIKIETEWEEAYQQYVKAKSITFDTQTRIMIHNKAAEMPLTRLDEDYYRDLQYTFNDLTGNTVYINKCTSIYSLAHFDSDVYSVYFDRIIKKRLKRVPSRSCRVSSLLTNPVTATYTAKSRKTPPNLSDIAVSNINRCLFKLAVEHSDCLEIWKPRTLRLLPDSVDKVYDNFTIPKASYDDNVVSFYKVAKSSPFPSQSYLAYYHVMEYHFLRVSEDKLHHHLRSMMNQTNFSANEDGLDKLISLVRKQDAKNDEFEMLRSVIQKFVTEDELITLIKKIEKECPEKIYTKKRKIFGELLEISINEGHVISNTAKVLKHIRNAIVHSSDRYKREDCHIPLSATEDLIGEFVPIVRFIAEKVIYGTAS